MKKYFMNGTEDELSYGDMIELDFIGEEDGVTKHSHLECKFVPELVDELLKEDIIEVREVKEKKPKAEPKKEPLEKRVTELEDRVVELEEVIANLMDELEEDE